jgi:hypothetical protein
MTHPNDSLFKLTESALSNLSPLDEADDVGGVAALRQALAHLEKAKPHWEAFDKAWKKAYRLPSVSDAKAWEEVGRTLHIKWEALVKFQKTLERAIKLAQKQSK